jgi:hypothetical protein
VSAGLDGVLSSSPKKKVRGKIENKDNELVVHEFGVRSGLRLTIAAVPRGRP